MTGSPVTYRIAVTRIDELQREAVGRRRASEPIRQHHVPTAGRLRPRRLHPRVHQVRHALRALA